MKRQYWLIAFLLVLAADIIGIQINNEILQYISAFNTYLKPDDLRQARGFVENRVTVENVLRVHAQGNEDQLRAAIFTLVHRGILRFVDIGKERLSDLLEIEPA